jgi:hypothetical protein
MAWTAKAPAMSWNFSTIHWWRRLRRQKIEQQSTYQEHAMPLLTAHETLHSGGINRPKVTLLTRVATAGKLLIYSGTKIFILVVGHISLLSGVMSLLAFTVGLSETRLLG